MNARIKELAEQALRESMQENINLQLAYTSGTLSTSKGLTDKLAELIVKECAYIADHAHGVSGSELLEHFGIEV